MSFFCNINKTANHLLSTLFPVGLIANEVLEEKLRILNLIKVSIARGDSLDRHQSHSD